jgi:hypothetical protein
MRHMALLFSRRRRPIGKRLEVCYVPFRYLGVMRSGKRSRAVDPYPVMHDGVFSSASSGGLNAVTWWIIQYHGLCLLGPERSALPLGVTWNDILSTMRFNLDVYFARQAKRPHIYLSDEAWPIILLFCRSSRLP